MTGATFSGPLAKELTEYLAFRRTAGGGSRSTLQQLSTLDRFTQTRLSSSGIIDEAFTRAWLAPVPGRGNNTRRSRYFLLRRFCLFLSDRRPEIFVPTLALCPPRRPAKPPYIYSRNEIRRLLAAASGLRDWDRWHPCPIRSVTLHTILLLLVTSGLRISEVLHLTAQDVDLDRGLLAVRQTKFRKSRLVPVSPGMLDALRRYAAIRFGGTLDVNAAFFISGRKQAYRYSTVLQLFHQILSAANIRGCSDRKPRLHDLRHTFAVNRLLLWYRAGENVMSRLPLLSTYLGHACVSDTEIYLQATPELLEEASQRFHRFSVDILPAGGEE